MWLFVYQEKEQPTFTGYQLNSSCWLSREHMPIMTLWNLVAGKVSHFCKMILLVFPIITTRLTETTVMYSSKLQKG